MTTYSIKLTIEGNGRNNVTSTTEKANSPVEAQQKVLERFGRLYRGKEITIISINPPQ
jgi:hypothetical protein